MHAKKGQVISIILKTEKIIHENENRYFLIFFKFMNKILNLQNYFWRESKKKEVVY